ncbi:MAG: type II secretion system F family protein [Pseudomonadota bacterium]
MTQLSQLLPDGLSADSVLLMLLTVVAFISVLAVWYGLVERDPMERRARVLADRRAELRGSTLGGSAAKSRSHSRRQQESLSLMRRVVMMFTVLRNQQSDKLNERLAQAGLRSRDAMIVFLFFKAAMPFVGAGAAFFLVYGLEMGDLSPATRLCVVLAGAVVGFLSPGLYVSNLTTKRQRALTKALPDALDLLVICAESGLALDVALERVSREIGAANTELAEELELTAIELGFLPERRQALNNLNRRTNLAAIRGVVNTLLQTEKYGTPLSQSLRVLATEFRDQRLLRAEEKAARLPATLTVPMIVFILPVLFVVLIGPAIISVMDNLTL